MFRRLRPVLPARSTRLGLSGVVLSGLLLSLAAHAQPTPAPSASALSAEERAQQQADKVFTWIRLHAEKPQARRNAPQAEPAANSNTTAQAKAAPKPASKPSPASAAPVAAGTAIAAAASSSPANLSSDNATQPSLPPQQQQAQSAGDTSGFAASEKTVLASASLASPIHATQAPQALPEPAAKPVPEPEPAPLKLLHKVDPEVPRQLQRDFRGGSVMLRFTVQADGSVGQAEAVNASNKRLALAAVAALTQWRFAPIDAPRNAAVEIGFQVE